MPIHHHATPAIVEDGSGFCSPEMAGRALRRELFFDHALLPDAWAESVRVEVIDGVIASVAGDAPRDGAERIPGIAIPGLPNLHSHAFQRAMAGLAERRGLATDSFWTWREVMYHFLARLSPDDVEAIAAFAYMEMLETGFTTVGEFHYLHHDIDGSPYADLGEMAARIAAASAETGIGLTLLPSLYVHGGFGAAPPAAGQRRFINDPERFLRLVERSRATVKDLPAAQVGIAPHSLRAVGPEELRMVCRAVPSGPIHIHAAEQVKEVEDSVADLGRRPVEWLIANAGIDSRWCVIHATHSSNAEVRTLAGSGAVAGLCPLTEASLGDGIFDATEYLVAGGRFGVGTDSNIQIDAAAELRQLEYGQRLARHSRNLMATRQGESTGRRLFAEAAAGGAQALRRPIGAIAAGLRADIVVLDADHADLASRRGDGWLDAWIFVVGRDAVTTVLVGGEAVVDAGRHRARAAATARYKTVLARLTDI
jgi:formimidoylglutamate deiminase